MSPRYTSTMTFTCHLNSSYSSASYIGSIEPTHRPSPLTTSLPPSKSEFAPCPASVNSIPISPLAPESGLTPVAIYSKDEQQRFLKICSST